MRRVFITLTSMLTLGFCLFQLAMGKMMEQGPVLVLTFNSQQILVVRDAKDNVVEGDPVSKIIQITNYQFIYLFVN